jgi:PAS domain S-box-containing protein
MGQHRNEPARRVLQRGATIDSKCRPRIAKAVIVDVSLARIWLELDQRKETRIAMSSTAKETVLIVEDDEDAALLERRALERRGFEVVTVGTMAGALAAVQARPFDLIIADYRLENETGLELFAQIRALGYDMPVIMVTGFSNESTVIEAIRQGVRDFVPKSDEYLCYLPDAVDRVLKVIRTERELAKSEARFQLFMDNSPAIAFLKDENGQMLYANPRFEQECGQSSLVGRIEAELWQEATADHLRANDVATLQAGGPLQFEETVVRSDGAVRHWTTYRFPIREPDGSLLLGGMAVNVSEQRMAEEALRKKDEQFRQAQKMEAVGTLAGGVAHEFNNLLQAIQGYTRYAMEGLAEEDERFQDLQQVLNASHRAATLTKQLLGFGRRQVLELTDIDPNSLVQDLVKMLRPLIGEHISIDLRLGANVAFVNADASHMQQLLMNLCVNARDAMPEGGQLLIKTENLQLSEAYCDVHPDVKPGRYLLLTVADTGAGIPPDVKEHIFEPFFTTKEVGKGTGLGLAMVYGVVQQHGGAIQVYSEPGIGTTFKIYLPTVDSAAETSVIPICRNSRGGTETILIAEDDPMVRDLAVRVLGKAGYQTITAADGEEAVRLFEANRDIISLALLDVVMPRLSGRDAFHRIKAIKPSVQAVFCTGYDPEMAQVGFVMDDCFRLIQKPFDPEVLLETIRELLDEVVCQSA